MWIVVLINDNFNERFVGPFATIEAADAFAKSAKEANGYGFDIRWLYPEELAIPNA